MRYAAERITTGEWLHHAVPLTGVERSRVLSGPGTLTATLQPELRDMVAADGLRVLEPWGTYVYAIDTNNRIRGGGIVTEPAPEEQGLRLTCAGFTAYPHGELYDAARNWGPIAGTGTPENPQVPPPDPIAIARDLWTWLQDRQDSNLGVVLIGDTKSSRTIGNYDEPYRLRWWETPDVGATIDDLASYTPFDYVEEYGWKGDKPERRLRIGFPRIGIQRTDLRFAQGENIALPVVAGEPGDGFANSVVGIGNGEGRDMIRVDSTVRDGRLRRTTIVTDKTVKSKADMAKLVIDMRERASSGLDITSVAVRDHPNARLSAIDVGDDIYVQAFLPVLGKFNLWVRVLSITEGDAPGTAVLSTQRSSAFTYSTSVSVS